MTGNRGKGAMDKRITINSTTQQIRLRRLSILAHSHMTLKLPLQRMRWPFGPDANETRPQLGLFCISNHNLIFNSYGDTHHSSGTKRTTFVTQKHTSTTKRRLTLVCISFSVSRDTFVSLLFRTSLNFKHLYPYNYEVLENILKCKKDPKWVIVSLVLGLDAHLVLCRWMF